jgi:transposase InsO family protein
MSVKMKTTIEEERWSWIAPLINKELTYAEVLLLCPHSKRSLERWVAAYKKYGLAGLAPLSTAPKTQPHETPIRIKEEVVTLRKQTKLCAQKLHWRLKKQGLLVPRSTISKILKAEGMVRKYRVKKVKYKYLKAERKPGELLEMDVKYVPGAIEGLKYYQYTVIDTATRWRHLEVFDEQTTYHSIRMMEIVQKLFPHQIKAIKTDNHSTFTNYYVGGRRRSDLTVKTVHALDRWCARHNITHYLIDPGKPAQNGIIERSHREDEEKFYQRTTFTSVTELKQKLRHWNEYYNNLEHCGLNGRTPNEVLLS